MDLVNDIVVTWDDTAQTKGSATINAKAEGEKICLVYNSATHLIDSVVSGDTELSEDVRKGIEDTSGTWSDKADMYSYKGRKSGHTMNKKAKKQYKPKVYFWTRKQKNGPILYCHSIKLCVNDPMGYALYEEWIKDPEAYMLSHSKLERK